MIKKYILFSLLFSIFLISCTNFIQGSSLKEDIDDAITYAKSPAFDVIISSDKGKISPAGRKAYKKTDKIDLLFFQDSEYQFIKWQVLNENDEDITDKGYFKFDSLTDSSTKAEFITIPEDEKLLKIEPLCVPHPGVVSYSPMRSADGAFRDARIEIIFNQNISPDSIYYTEKELKAISTEATLLKSERSEEEKYYGYVLNGEIFYKNIVIKNKNTGANLLSCYGEPFFETEDTFVIPAKIGENAPNAGTQIYVSVKDFFYEYEDNQVKLSSAYEMLYFVNGNTDNVAPSIPQGYFINGYGKAVDGSDRQIVVTEEPASKETFLASYLKNKKLSVNALVYDTGSGVLSSEEDENGKVIKSGFYAKITQVKDDEYETPLLKTVYTVPLKAEAIMLNALCEDTIDFSNYSDGLYKVDFFAKDKNGNISDCLETLYVISDSTAPAPLELSSTYFGNEASIVACWGWKNGTVKDYDYAVFKAEVTKNNETTIIDGCNNVKLYDEFNKIIRGVDTSDYDAKYTFTVYPVDIFGNVGETVTNSKTPINKTILKEITLDKYHIRTDISNTIKATAYFESIDFDLDSVVSIKLYNGSTLVTSNNVTINMKTCTAETEFTISANSSNSGKTYTVKTYIGSNTVCNEDGDEVSVRLFASATPSLTRFTIDKSKMDVSTVTDTTTLTSTLTGNYLDLADLRLQIYDSKGHPFGSEIPVSTKEIQWTATTGLSNHTITAVIPVPNVEDEYVIKANLDGKDDLLTQKLHVYGKPKFHTFLIPPASTTRAGDGRTIRARLFGKNFLDSGLDQHLSEISLSCGTLPELALSSPACTIVSDTLMYVEVPIGSLAGNHAVTIKYSDQKATGNFCLKEPTDWTPGDLIRADGKIILYDPERTEFLDDDFKDEEGNIWPPVAVYAGNSESGAAICVGVHNSNGESVQTYSWAPSVSNGYKTKFEEIYQTDTDGSDNWDIICKIDPEGTSNAAVNYPAFNYANNYGVNHNLSGEMAEGWYLPTVSELSIVANQYKTINNVISMICKNRTSKEELLKIGLYTNLNTIDETKYWTSNQNKESSYTYISHYVIVRSPVKVDVGIKSSENCICAVKDFNYDGTKPILHNAKKIKVNAFRIGGKVKVLVSGRNFNLPDFDRTLIKVNCETIPELYNYSPAVTVVNENTLSFELPVTDNPGEHTINIIYEKQKISASYIINKKHTEWIPGDLVLSDYSVIPADCCTDLTVEDFINKDGNVLQPVGIYIGTNKTGAELILGLHNTDGNKLTWAPSGSFGYKNKIPVIEYNSTDTSKANDYDGEDNWNYICSVDETAKDNAVVNYPAFNYANNYGQTYNMSDNFKDGWYIPSVDEMELINTNATLINNNLNSIKSIDYENISLSQSPGLILRNYFWSSCKVNGSSYQAYYVIMGHTDLGIYSGSCENTYNVLCVKNIRQDPYFLEAENKTSYKSDAGKSITVALKGRNFTSKNNDASNFSLTCNTLPELNNTKPDNIEVTDDFNMTISIKVPSVAGVHTITVTNGINDISFNYQIIDNYVRANRNYNIGDVICTNDVIIPYDENRTDYNFTTADGKKCKPCAVYFGQSVNGEPLAIGLNQTSEKWATTGSMKIYISDLVDIQDGSNSWSIICNTDELAESNPDRYPAFAWVNNYSSSYTNNIDMNWYLPSCYELNVLFNKDTRTTINKVLTKLNATTLDKDNYFYYWSCNNANSDSSALIFVPYTLSTISETKTVSRYIRAIRKLTPVSN